MPFNKCFERNLAKIKHCVEMWCIIKTNRRFQKIRRPVLYSNGKALKLKLKKNKCAKEKPICSGNLVQ